MNHLHENISLESVAAAVGLEKTYFCRLFTRSVGMGFPHYVMQEKIKGGLYGSRCIEFLFHTDKVVGPFLVVYSFVSILGATVDLGLLWSIADTFNGLMSIPNPVSYTHLASLQNNVRHP